MLLLSSLIFGCSKDDVIETKKSTPPTQEEVQLAKTKLQPIDGWNSPEETNFTSLKSARVTAGEVLQISGYYSDGGTYVISGNLHVYGCVPGGQKIHVVYWIYDFAIGQWKNASQQSGQCMAENGLDIFITYYSNNARTDFYVSGAVQIYIENMGQFSLWGTFYSNTIFLNGPF